MIQPQGRITMEGQDYISFTPEELRRRIIMVPQSVSLFSGTLAENLRIAAPQATDEELWEALEQVRLKDWASGPAGWAWRPTWATPAANSLADSGKK